MSLTYLPSPNLARTMQVSKAVVRGEGGIVVAQNRHAAEIGARVLKQGGSAIDAAIATSFAIGVLEPWMSGVGGIGGMVIRRPDGTVSTIDAGAISPAALKVEDFTVVDGSDSDLFGWPNVIEGRNTTGAKAVCTPALVAGLGKAHAAYGKLAWADLLAPAVALAKEGAAVDYHTTMWVALEMKRLMLDAGSRAWFLKDGVPPATPAASSGKALRLPVPALAATLQKIASEGPQALYQGALAADLVADLQALGGYLSMADMAACAPKVAAPATVSYRDYTMHVMPELNGGVTIGMAMRHCAEHYKPAENASHTPDTAAFMAYAEGLQAAWEHRFSRLGDGADRSMPSCTTHISVVDRDGTVISLTQTLLSSFGACVVSPKTGILMNNGINWFDPRPGRPNSLGAARQALGNFAPAVFTGPDDVIAIGGSGGRKIIPAVFQALTQIADFGVGLDVAIGGPRLDISAPPVVVADDRLSEATLQALGERYETVAAPRIASPSHFTILGAVRRRGNMNEGLGEPQHPWADACSEDALN